MSARYEITLCDTRVEITDPWGCVLTIYDGAHEMTAGAIRQQSADIAALKDALADEVTANEAFRKAGGARDDEDMPTFCARLIAERDKYRGQLFDCELALKMEHDLLREKRAELAAAVAERDMLSELAQRRERQLSVALNEVEQLRAYKQAVDSAPVVARPKFIRGEICGCQTRPTHYVGEMDCPWHKRGDGQPKEAKD